MNTVGTSIVVLLRQLQQNLDKIKQDCDKYSRLLNRYIELYPDGVEFRKRFSVLQIEHMISSLNPERCPKNKYPTIVNWLRKQIK